jgi:hypothetical protein
LTKHKQTALNVYMQAHRPTNDSTRSVVRLGLALVAVAVLHAAVSSSAIDVAAWSAPGRPPDELLVVVLAWAGLGLSVWLAIGSTLALLSGLPGPLGRWCALLANHLTPLLVRRALAAAIGTSAVSLALPPAPVVGTVAAPTPQGPEGASTAGALQLTTQPLAIERASAPGRHPASDLVVWELRATVPERSASDAGASARSDTSAMPGPGFGPTPEPGPAYRPTAPDDARANSPAGSPGFRPTRQAPVPDESGLPLLAPSPRPGAATLDTVTVRRGDTLWSIAERHLGSAASDVEIARAWPQWYAANRAVIGDDPDLIHPGTQLVPPREGDLP